MCSPIEKNADLERHAILEIPVKDVEKEIQEELKKFANTTKLRGFRPGKVPITVAKQIQGSKIQQNVLNRFINSAFEALAINSGQRIAGIASIKKNSEKSSVNVLAFDTTFEIYPEIKFPDFSAISVVRYVSSISDAAIGRILRNLQKQYAEFKPITNEPAQDGHRITIDFISPTENTPFYSYKNQNFSFFLGENFVYPELESAVRGMRLGDEKSFSIKNKSHDGKEKNISIRVSGIDIVNLKNFAEIFSKKKTQTQSEESIETELRISIRESANRQIRNWASNCNRKGIMEILANSIKLDVPKVLIKNQIEKEISKMKQDSLALETNRTKKQESELNVTHDLISNAERHVRLNLIISELIKINQITINSNDVRARVEEYSKDYERPTQFINHCLSNQKRYSEIESILIEESIVNYVFSLAKIDEKYVPFEKLMEA